MDSEKIRQKAQQQALTKERRRLMHKRQDAKDKEVRASADRFTADYLKAEKEIVFNDGDPDLHPIKVELPKHGDIKNIDGYGQTAFVQVFKKHKDLYPDTWKSLMHIQKTFDTVEACIAELRSNREKYKNEIAFIQRDHERFANGYWFFCGGKPTYITGAHYRYLNYWYAGSGHPQYRSRDRKFFIFYDFVKHDPFACGFNYPKFRREGATSKMGCICYHEATTHYGVQVGIQSKDDAAGLRVFKDHIVQRWKKLPFWQKPVYEGFTEPKSSLNFFPPTKHAGTKGVSSSYTKSLESWIDFGASTEGYYDGAKLKLYYGDESGKVKNANVHQRHMIVKPCVTEGNKYIGMIVNTSTVGDMEKGGGDNFKSLCKASHYGNRNDNNETSTGLYNMFIPSYDGFDLEDKSTGKKFIDKYGNSDIEATRNYLIRRRESLKKSGDSDALAEEIRQYPFTFAECFRGSSMGCNFNVTILNDRLDHFRFGNPYIVEGNFVWEGGVKDSRVIWQPCNGGKFKVSLLLPEGKDNLWTYSGGVRVPGNTTFGCAGGDPFKFNVVVDNNRKSDGAGAVFCRFNPSIDDPRSEPDQWKTDRFCCTYSNRPPTKEIYGEDMLMMCVYYGVEMYPEVNVPFLWDYFKDRGYGGYLYYRIDPKTGRYSKSPGLTTTAKVQEEIYGEYGTYVERCGMREVHDEILKQCLDIEDDMGEFDLFVAGGYALLGCRREVSVDSLQGTNIVSFHRKKRYA